MLIKNCNAFDLTNKQRFRTLTRDNLGGGGGGFIAINQVGNPVHLHTLHIPKATTVCHIHKKYQNNKITIFK